ncbi:MAG: hypothetical protein ACYTFW_12115 [Planctomycetota bacterium]|jgi:hypothetical protein
MKRKNDNLSRDDSATPLNENISRLLKLAGEPDKPSRTFTESLTDSALNELKQSAVKTKSKKHIIIKSNWSEKAMGWAAMVAVACGAGLTIVVSALLKMNFLLQAIVVLTILFNWITYLGGRIL